MGYIKEPKGVDFIIKSRPLTDDDRKSFSEFIRKSKAKNKLHGKKKKTVMKILR